MEQTPSTPFRQMPVDQFLDALGSSRPTPGGGAAACILGAEACALAEMASRLTLSNPDYAALHEKARAWIQIFGDARSIMLDLADADAANFQALMDTMRLPKTAPGRAEAVQKGLEKAAEAPMQTAQTLADILPLFTAVLQEGNKNLISDSLIALQCAITAVRASVLNVRINLKYMKNEFFVRETAEAIRRWEDAVSAADAVLTYQVTL